MSFASMLEGLVSSGARFVVVGGVAGALHGSERVTNDLDIVYDVRDAATMEGRCVWMVRRRRLNACEGVRRRHGLPPSSCYSYWVGY